MLAKLLYLSTAAANHETAVPLKIPKTEYYTFESATDVKMAETYQANSLTLALLANTNIRGTAEGSFHCADQADCGTDLVDVCCAYIDMWYPANVADGGQLGVTSRCLKNVKQTDWISWKYNSKDV